MATRTTNAELAETIAGQQKTITQALSRISTLTDEVASLRNEVRRFKQDVAKDVTYLTERVS
jgi:ABC-type transporter Mla subunit MlaD